MQILSATHNNASNNNTLVNELADLLDGFQGKATRVRCFAHVLNLVVKASAFRDPMLPYLSQRLL